MHLSKRSNFTFFILREYPWMLDYVRRNSLLGPKMLETKSTLVSRMDKDVIERHYVHGDGLNLLYHNYRIITVSKSDLPTFDERDGNRAVESLVLTTLCKS